ncbi:MAG: NAD(P)-binding protein [Deltaproteobacteria bacterium]|nr:NAD(P)-binding protein [Deltaproteobacteria bacterium]MBW2535389.1 NAD(P)-binding protein [Deltaproteobacteria bacterium]
MLTADYLIVGSGLTGAVIARRLADEGRDVLVLERRSHLGGNVHDHHHPCGIRVHTYGPHYFRTSREDVWEFVTRFSSFDPYEAIVQTYVDGQHENWPVAASLVRRLVGEQWQCNDGGDGKNFEEASLAMMPRVIYDKFVRPYTLKQWGIDPQELGADLARRFDVRADGEPRLTPNHRHQGIPSEGYAVWMGHMLQSIPVVLHCDYLQHREQFQARKRLVFTGPIDELFGFSLGKLMYRAQRREHEYLPDTDWHQPCGQVNNPDPAYGDHIRTLEWKHMLPGEYAKRIRGTVITRETTCTPTDSGDYEYPIPEAANRALYQRYREMADADEQLLVCGRLGEYRYYDMDHAIARAMELAADLLAAD